ncbi:MAG: IS66 family insertion sequence element accessory protein TnpA [Syntrophobacteraceae bacterium]
MSSPKSEDGRFWERHIEKWKTSGLTQAEYCRKNGINIRSFYRWKRKTDALYCKPVLVELPITGTFQSPFSPPGQGPQLCLVYERLRIEIGKGFDSGDFERVVRILGLL